MSRNDDSVNFQGVIIINVLLYRRGMIIMLRSTLAPLWPFIAIGLSVLLLLVWWATRR